MHRSTALFVFLVSHYGVLSAKVIDFHLPNAEEEHMIETVERARENEEAWETFNDEEATDEERYEALETLVDNEKIV